MDLMNVGTFYSLPTANVTIFRPSSFFIIAKTSFGLQMQIQLVPMMQLFVHLDPSFSGKTCGKKHIRKFLQCLTPRFIIDDRLCISNFFGFLLKVFVETLTTARQMILKP